MPDSVDAPIRAAAAQDNSIVHIHFVDRPGQGQWHWQCTAELDDFLSTAVIAEQDPNNGATIRTAINTIVSRVIANNPPPASEGLDWQTQLGGMLMMYAGSAKAVQGGRAMRAGSSFLVLNYRKTAGASELLRPAVINAFGELTAVQLQVEVDKIVAADKIRYPQWFM